MKIPDTDDLIIKLSTSLKQKKNISAYLKSIKVDYERITKKNINLMHVCGTHEDTIMKNGLRYLLKKHFPKIRLIAGPGCPVCITPVIDIDSAIFLTKHVPNVIMTSFGDMIRVPGSYESLETCRQQGYSVKTVYSIIDAVKLAKNNPDKEIIFVSPGFETTAPTTAVEIYNQPPDNFSVLCSLRLLPPALEVLANLAELDIDGYILPGHVSVIVGRNYYQNFFDKYRTPCAIAGFEPADLLAGVRSLISQIALKQAKLENVYTRAVTDQGNLTAKQMLKEVFDNIDAGWRGLGIFPKSGYELKKKYDSWNARIKFNDILEDMDIIPRETPKGCSCPDVILGKIEPESCILFNKACTPEHPIGPCMVGLEGTCRIRSLYGD